MRNMLAFVAVVALAAGGVGWYLGWFSVEKSPSGSAGQRRYTVDVNTSKITNDLHSAEQKIEKKLAEKKREPATSTPAAAAVPATGHKRHGSEIPSTSLTVGSDGGAPQVEVPTIHIDR
jgi:hypothetical protein